MAYETLSRAPALDDFTPLSEHQEQTPGTFFGGKPVLHLQSPAARVRINQSDLSSQPDFAAFQQTQPQSSDGEVELDSIDIWVTSRHLTLFSTAQTKGLQIPYPTISIHAQEGNAVLLELNLSPPDTMDEDLIFLQLRLVPTSVQHNAAAGTNGESSADPVAALYNAISACQELNPDPRPDGDEDEDEGFDATAPGATGWITSENMADFMDEDGNLRIPQGANVIDGEEEVEDEGLENGLGPGAGHRRTAAEADADAEGGADGEDDETKWQRTG